jgi:hypothetical protein
MGDLMKKLLCALALAGMLIAPNQVQAQFTLGPVAAFHDDFDFGIGAYAGIPVPSLHENISINPSFVYFFPDGDFDYLEINGDVVYSFEVSEDVPVLPFALAGINIARLSVPEVSVGGFGTVGGSTTEVGLNIGGGVGFRAASLNPFVGAKFELEGGEGFVLFGGVGFPVGG